MSSVNPRQSAIQTKHSTPMNGTEKVVEHLKMIQTVINRLNRNSFWVKTLSAVLIVAAMVLVAIQGKKSPVVFLMPLTLAAGFWILDGYFLWQERLFREVFNEIRVQSDTDFEMNPLTQKNKPKCSWLSAIFSPTLIIFYLMEIVCIIAYLP